MFPLLSYQLYGYHQQAAASNTSAFSAALAGTYCTNLVLMSKARHVVCGPARSGTMPSMVRLSTDHMHCSYPKIKDLLSTLRNLLRREEVCFLEHWYFKGAEVCDCRSFSILRWCVISHWRFSSANNPRDSVRSQKYQEIYTSETHTRCG